MAPVTQGVHVAEVQARFQTLRDVGDSAGDFAGHEGFAATRRFVVEQNAVTGVHAVRFTVVDGDPVGIQFGDRIRRARIERSGLFLWNFLHQAVQFRSGSLIETRFLLQPQEADGFQQTQRAHRIHVGGIFRRLKRHGNVAHRAEVIHFIRLHFLQNARQVGAVGQITVVQVKFRVAAVRILIDVIDTFGVKGRSTAFNPVNFIAFFQQQFCQIRTVLPRYAGNKCDF